MRLLYLYPMLASLAWSTVAVGPYRVIVDFTEGRSDVQSSRTIAGGYYCSYAEDYDFEIVADAAGDKFFIFHGSYCKYPPPNYNDTLNLLHDSPDGVDAADCGSLASSRALEIGPVAATLRSTGIPGVGVTVRGGSV